MFAMHMHYAEFMPALLKLLEEEFMASLQDNSKAARRRLLFRLSVELILVGCSPKDPQMLARMLKSIMSPKAE